MKEWLVVCELSMHAHARNSTDSVYALFSCCLGGLCARTRLNESHYITVELYCTKIKFRGL